jgi:hypothetical protein
MVLVKGVKEHRIVKRWYVKFLIPISGDPHRPKRTYIWRKHIKLHRGDNAYVLVLRFLRSEVTIQVYHKDMRGFYLEYSLWRKT